MSELSVSERRIKPIHDAIEGENWKQALQICEKWQKKGEKSDHFQVRALSTCRPN
jgi:ribosomal protein L22